MIGLFRSPGIVYLQTVARDSLVQRLTAVSSLIRSSCSKLVMARNRRPCKPNQKMPVRKGRQERCQYRLGLKATVVHWKTVDKLTPQQIRMKVIAELGHDVPLSTLSTWWSDKTLEKISEVGPDRTNGNHTRRINTQRRAILIDMEHILVMKVKAMQMTGIPCTREGIQILAIDIFHKLASYNLYDHNGHRNHPGENISADIIDRVKHSKIVMCKSNKNTEFHKSVKTMRNAARANLECKLCPRKFKGKVNMTLHVYWHTIEQEGGIENPLDMSDDEDDEEQFKFTASAGWVFNFLRRHDLRSFQMKGEKGSADHRAPDHDAVVTQICCMIDSLDVGHCPRSNI